MMSVRNMLKVMMSLLLAVTLAATTAHAARLDQSFASVAEETLQVKGKSENSGLIPYTECMKTCSKCACTLMWPPEINWCSCLDDSVPKNAEAVADRLDQSLASITKETLPMKGKSENSGLIPYTECMKTCSSCACTKMWPPEINWCSCSDKSVPKKAEAVADRLDQSLASITEETLQMKGKSENSGLIPYTECMKTCISCACTKMWPPEINWCSCSDKSVPKKAEAVADRLDQSLASITKETLQMKGKSENSGLIPYTECMKTCSGCVCTKMWPSEINWCSCSDKSVPNKAEAVADRLDQSLASITEKANELYEKLDLLAGPVPKRTGEDDKKMVLWTTSKMEAIPYKECINTCETCLCPQIWPPEAAMCICVTPKPQAGSGKDVAK